MLRRNLRIDYPSIQAKAYVGLVLPQMEYCGAVWDPHTKGNIRALEMIQELSKYSQMCPELLPQYLKYDRYVTPVKVVHA